MDQLFTKAQLDMQERMEILPQELIDLITDGVFDAVVFDLQQKHALTDEQKELLENEIIFVLTLFTESQHFAAHVAESLGVDEDTAQEIAQTVTDEIFTLVQDILDTVTKARKEIQPNIGKVNIPEKMERREDLDKLATTLSKPDPQRLQDPNVHSYTDNIEPIHTMEGDIERVHGYGAYREQEEKNASEVTVEEPDKSSDQNKEDDVEKRG